MANHLATEFETSPGIPARLDNRLVNAVTRRSRATKPPVALEPGDRLFLGRLPRGAAIVALSANSDTALPKVHLSIGTDTEPDRFAAAREVKVTDTPVALGPRGAAHAATPLGAEEELWLTVTGAAVPAEAVLVIDTEFALSA
ncbi:hypothetical protein [Sphingomonas sp. BK235]|uniref:hypothetical protein n=1 Tax=Sphingomonas sp. BK235 TaxID=2512131 RepID=UPI0010529606|nr:hypothetical protein [Sphingomonas sp. BK235]TCP35911.1 hypothetical protein EV292_102501 [Sphingomonas sp. BK235]